MNNRRLVSLVKDNVVTAWDKAQQIECMIALNLEKLKRSKKKAGPQDYKELAQITARIIKEELIPPLVEARRRLEDEQSTWVGTQEIIVTIPEGQNPDPFLKVARETSSQIQSLR